jgi:hypothetical protein
MEEPGMDMGMGGEEEIPSELDLEAIIRELELDVDDAGLGAGAGLGADIGAPPAPEAVPGLEDEEPQLESFQEVDAGVRVDGAFDGSVNETLSGDGDHGVFTDGKSPADAEGVPGGKKVSAGQTVTGTKAETMTEEMDLDEILREVEAEEAAAMRESSKITAENAALRRDLREHREVIQFLRGKLQEVNMLNAKLLFTNRLFKSFDLSGARKKAIVETFDRATNPREVKLIYTTLAESLAGKTSGATAKKTARMVAEGIASKPIGSTAPKSDAASKTILAEGNDLVARLQKLAGIKKNS